MENKTMTMKRLILLLIIFATTVSQMHSQNLRLASEIYQGADRIMKWQYSDTTKGYGRQFYCLLYL